VVLEVYQILQCLCRLEDGDERVDAYSKQWYLVHVAINVCLFPPIFFFSVLYYTDIASLLFVLLSYHASIVGLRETSLHWGIMALQLFYSLLSLLFRQTNVFWVSIFPIGLTVLDIFKRHGQFIRRTPMDIFIEGKDSILHVKLVLIYHNRLRAGRFGDDMGIYHVPSVARQIYLPVLYCT
jgi:hypothetical protein